MELIKESKFQIACDVDNVLCGENGASYVYAKQKGAGLIVFLDGNLKSGFSIIKW